MTIRVVYPGTQVLPVDLGQDGALTVHVNANVHGGEGVGEVSRVVALVWERAPRGARMSQTMAFRGFLRLADGRQVTVTPSPPATDISTAARELRHPLSPPAPAPRQWVIDALADPARRDLGRVYVTDESYEFSERQGQRVVFYDRPRLMVEDARAVATTQADGARATRFVLEGRFHTHLFDRNRWLGLVLWGCSWSQGVEHTISVVSSEPRYAEATFHRQRPNDALSEEELRARMSEWQRAERRRPLRRSPRP